MSKDVKFFLVIEILIILVFLLFGNIELYFSELLNTVKNNPSKYIVISFLTLLSDVVLPIPSSVVMYMNGFVLGVFSGTVLSVFSLVIGALIGYYLGRMGNINNKKNGEEKAHVLLGKYGALAILITRGIPIISESICIVCGFNKMPLKNYLLYNLIGYIPLCLLYSLSGSIGYTQDVFMLAFGCSLLLAFIFWLLGKYLLIFEKGN